MNKGWRFYLGIGLLIANFAGYGLAALVPFMGLSAASATAWISFIILLAELSFIAGVCLLGKQFIEMLKAKCKAWFACAPGADRPAPVSRARHYTGIAMLIASFLPYFIAELMLILGYSRPGHIRLIIGMLLASDGIFIASLFVLGVEFWERLKKLFEWPGPAGEIAD